MRSRGGGCRGQGRGAGCRNRQHKHANGVCWTLYAGTPSWLSGPLTGHGAAPSRVLSEDRLIDPINPVFWTTQFHVPTDEAGPYNLTPIEKGNGANDVPLPTGRWPKYRHHLALRHAAFDTVPSRWGPPLTSLCDTRRRPRCPRRRTRCPSATSLAESRAACWKPPRFGRRGCRGRTERQRSGRAADAGRVEAAAPLVEGQVVGGRDREVEERADGFLVLCQVEPLEGTRPRGRHSTAARSMASSSASTRASMVSPPARSEPGGGIIPAGSF